MARITDRCMRVVRVKHRGYKKLHMAEWHECANTWVIQCNAEMYAPGGLEVVENKLRSEKVLCKKCFR